MEDETRVPQSPQDMGLPQVLTHSCISRWWSGVIKRKYIAAITLGMVYGSLCSLYAAFILQLKQECKQVYDLLTSLEFISSRAPGKAHVL